MTATKIRRRFIICDTQDLDIKLIRTRSILANIEAGVWDNSNLQDGLQLPMSNEECRLSSISSLLGESWDSRDTCPGEDFLGIPDSFAKSMKQAMATDMRGVGTGLTEKDALNARAEALLKKATERANSCLRALNTSSNSKL